MGDPATEGIGLDRYHGALAHPATVPQARRTDDTEIELSGLLQ
jgi:hypothetical protein